jgi:GNAT superfamily N-acetyltransferase
MRSHFHLLQTLTLAPPIAPSIYKALFHHLKACPETYFIVVVIDRSTDQMVAHGTLLVERKFIHGGSIAGHIEDIVVNPEARGGGLGKNLVVGLKDLGLAVGCYKITLDCKVDRICECSSTLTADGLAFYEKCG